MQKDKTLQFWDDFYRSEQIKVEAEAKEVSETTIIGSIKEWIVQPSDELFELVLRDLFSTSRDGGETTTAMTNNGADDCSSCACIKSVQNPILSTGIYYIEKIFLISLVDTSFIFN